MSQRQGTLGREVRKSDELGGTALSGSKGTWGSWDGSQDHCWEGYQAGESPHLLRYLQFVPETDLSVPLVLT